jgi:hypothetical protein
VKLGGGRTTLALAQCLPDRCIQDLTDITKRYANKDL